MTTEKMTTVTTTTDRPARFGRSNTVWLAITLVSAIVFGASLYVLFNRIRDYNAQNLTRYAFAPLYDNSFTFAGRDVTITDVPDDTGNTLGSVRIAYGEDSITLPVRIRGVEQVPDLRRHENWMKVMRFIDTTGVQPHIAEQEVREGKREDRLTIATRIPPPGADTKTWGEVWRSDWRFELYELLPDGGFEAHKLKFPTSKRKGGPQEGDLAEGTWQYGAALLTMPPKSAPPPVFGHDAWSTFGRAFPTAAISGFVLAIALSFTFAPKRKTA